MWGGNNNIGDGVANDTHRYSVLGQTLLNHHEVGSVSRSPEGLFARHKGELTMGRFAMWEMGMTRGPQATLHTSGNMLHMGTWSPPACPLCPGTVTQQDLLTSPRWSDPTGGFSGIVSARRGSDTPRANHGLLQRGPIIRIIFGKPWF